MADRVVIAGASGFLGTFLTEHFRRNGAMVSTIGRSGADAAWSSPGSLVALLDGADLLVNLAGKSVNCRYTRPNRAEILRSRISTTNCLSEAIAACATPPPLWINSSTATIYRHSEDRAMSESGGELGTGFSVGIATAWEQALFEMHLPHTRRVALRMAIVLGDGSALQPLVRLVRSGLGGPQLDGRWFRTRARVDAGTFHEVGALGGRQRFSWIHIEDVARIIDFLRARPDLHGAINASSPNPSDNRTMMRALRRVLRMPIGLPAPRIVLELGCLLIRSETELVLKSRWVIPDRLSRAGYEFAHPELEPALEDIIRDGR